MEKQIDITLMKGVIDVIPIEKKEKILNQMKNCVFKINGNELGTGFFCKILYKNEYIPILMTNYHIIDDNYLENNRQIIIYINNNYKIININKNNKIYSSEKNEYDIMMIKIKEEEINDYLELDNDIFQNNPEISFKDNSIYMLHFPNNGNISISLGYNINKINQYDIKFLCNNDIFLSGGPIINLSTNKVIGIYKGYNIDKNKNVIYNLGTYLKYPLDEINKENKIIMEIKINKDDINKKIYFLDNTDDIIDGKKHFHDNLKELNDLNTEFYINNKKYEYNKYFIPEKEGIYNILLKFNTSIKDCSFMFYDVKNITNIDFSSFDSKNAIDMSYMFSWCISLNSLQGISNLVTKNVTNMSYLFAECRSLISLPDISKWNIQNVTNMSLIFCGCISLISLPDISKWDTKNVINISGMFYNCSSLNSLPDISKWDTKSVANMSYMFYKCSTLNSLPDISKWDFKNVTDMNDMFVGCTSLNSIPQFKIILNK